MSKTCRVAYDDVVKQFSRVCEVMLLGLVLCETGCASADLFVRVVDISLAQPKGRPSRYYPYSVVVPLAADVFAADRCRVRVEPLVYAVDATWDGVARTGAHGADEAVARAIATFATRIGKEQRDVLGTRGRVQLDLPDAPFVVRTTVVAINTQAGVINANGEVVRIADNAKVGRFAITAGVSRGDPRQWMASTSWALAVGVHSYFADHFACKQPAVVVDTPAGER